MLDTTAAEAGTKVYISIGGIYQMGAWSLNWVASDPTRAHDYARAAIAFANRHNYSGIEVDWEPPQNNTLFRRMIRLLKREMTAQGGSCQNMLVQAFTGMPDGTAGGINDSVEVWLWMMYGMYHVGSGYSEPEYNITGFDSPLVPVDSTQYGTKWLHYRNGNWSGLGYDMVWGDSGRHRPSGDIKVNSGPFYNADSLGLGREKQVL